jgi:hypothetical protein
MRENIGRGSYTLSARDYRLCRTMVRARRHALDERPVAADGTKPTARRVRAVLLPLLAEFAYSLEDSTLS